MPRPAATEESIRERFFAKVDRRGDNECWPWLGSLAKNGYGQFWEGATVLAHRKAFFYANGRDSNFQVCHSCDNRSCCNPNHLWEGSGKENMQDASRKGRILGKRGESQWNSKLSRTEVREIRDMLRKGDTQRAIAKKFNVSQATVNLIAARKRWAWLE